MDTITPVTRPFLPPIKEYNIELAKIWERNWLTNNGPVLQTLERRLQEYLDLQNHELVYVTNGTIALQIAIRALNLEGEIITTPFSYVATSSSIVWEKCTPVFVDILPTNYTLDSSLIEAAITENTVAILATHVFGIPCDLEATEEVANRHNLKLIYDAAHSFGTKYNEESVFKFGDISATSFHATKLFHTVEGGALITADKELAQRCRYMRNFGHDGPLKFNGVGINGKNSELHAAMGLINLNYVDDIIADRRRIYEEYLSRLDNQRFQTLSIPGNLTHNYSYFPILFRTKEALIEAQDSLANLYNVQTRRYFYPLLSQLDYTKKTCTSQLEVAEQVSSRILCLPSYFQLPVNIIKVICEHLNTIN